MDTPLLSTREAARALRVSYWTLVSWRRPTNLEAPNLPFVRIGRLVFYHQADVRALLGDRRVQAREPAALGMASSPADGGGLMARAA